MGDGRRDEIERLFREHGKGVGGYVLARVGSAELAEAITARVFLTVVRRFDQCRTSPAGWLWSIARTEIARHFRDRKEHAPLDERIPDRSAGPEEEAVRHEMQGRMRVALARLNEEQQRLIYMKFFQEMPNVEIAKATGYSVSNVGVMVHRAIKKLREWMEEEQGVAAEVRRGGGGSGGGGEEREL